MRRVLSIVVTCLVVAAACSSTGDDEEPASAPDEATTTEAAAGSPSTTSGAPDSTSAPSTTSAPGAQPEGDPTLALDQGPDAPEVASDVPTAVLDEPVGRIGFTRYVYVDSAGVAIPSLVEGPVGSQVRCQDPALPCSYLDLAGLLADGAEVPDELAMSGDELADLVDELGQVEAAIARYPDADAACAEGYVPDRSQTPNMGSHFTSTDRIRDGEFDPGDPEIIMFARTDDQTPDGPLGTCGPDGWDGVDVEAVGVAFYQPFAFVGDDHFEGFAGPLDNWHVHHNLCRLDGRDITVLPDVCAGQGGTIGEFEPSQFPTSPQGAASEGWMIHAWASADHDNQLGVFSMWNPAVWPVSDPQAVVDSRIDVSRGAGTEVIDDFALPDVRLDQPGTVSFFNTDGVAHTVTAGAPLAPLPDLFDSGLVGTREVTSITLDEPGTYEYFCTLHPDMQATITVG